MLQGPKALLVQEITALNINLSNQFDLRNISPHSMSLSTINWFKNYRRHNSNQAIFPFGKMSSCEILLTCPFLDDDVLTLTCQTPLVSSFNFLKVDILLNSYAPTTLHFFLKSFFLRRLTVMLGWVITNGGVVLCTSLDWWLYFIQSSLPLRSSKHTHTCSITHSAKSDRAIPFPPCHHVPFTKRVIYLKEISYFLQNNFEPHATGPAASYFLFQLSPPICHSGSLDWSQTAQWMSPAQVALTLHQAKPQGF